MAKQEREGGRTPKPVAEDEGDGFPDPVKVYLQQIGKIPLLTVDQEVELAERIRRGKMAQKALANSRGQLTEKKREQFKQRVIDGGEARDHLIRANTRFVVFIAKKFRGRGVPFLDLIQEGNIGLMKAMPGFDPKRGPFVTYAAPGIRQRITKAIVDQGRTIHLPGNINDRINTIRRVADELVQELGREPTHEEVANILGINWQEMADLLMMAQKPISLEEPVDDEDDSVRGDFIPDDTFIPPDVQVLQAILSEKIATILKHLGLRPREEKILRLRYGLPDGRWYTVKEVAQMLGIKSDSVKGAEAKALRRLRYCLQPAKEWT